MKDATNRPEPDRIEGAAHPRHTTHLVGQNAAEAAFLKAHAAKRLHHAWLLTGPRGVGKATLAWRVARFLLASTPGDGDDNPAQTLDIQSDHPVAIRIAALSEPRLFLLRRGWDEKTERLKTVITVDEVRRLKGFFSLTAADGGRRVVIVDAADEMNNSAANALLKVLEEPPDGAVLILVSHRPSALPATIRSRCRILRLNALNPEQMATALSQNGVESEAASAAALAELAGGSAGEAIRLLNLDGIETYSAITGLFATLPGIDRPRLLKLADSVTGRAAQPRFGLMLDLIDMFLARTARTGALDKPPREAVAGESELLRRLSPTPAAGRAWAGLQQELSSRTRLGAAVNLDPAALILDMAFKTDRTAAKWTAPQGGP